MNYRDKVINHLSDYKENKLWILDSVQINNQSYRHVLPDDVSYRNFISSGVEYLMKKREVSLHKDFSHLNSSQIMCMNFFTHFFKSMGAAPQLFPSFIKKVFQIDVNGFETTTSCYERVLEEEEYKDGTHFDFFVRFQNNIRLFFEVKYTESEFGKGKPNKTDYVPLLQSSLLLKQLGKDMEQNQEVYNHFYSYYQLYRNIMYIEKESDVVIFIYPKSNEKLEMELNQFRYHNPYFRDHPQVKFIPWEDLIVDTFDFFKDQVHYLDYYHKFYEKYLDL